MSAEALPFVSPTLENVQRAFDHWRAIRGKRTRTPIRLQRQAVALYDTHPASHICRALKINDTALKRWAKQTLPVSEPALVELPAEPAAGVCPDVSAPLTHSICIEWGDALRLRVEGHFTLEQVVHAVRSQQARP